MHAHPLFEMHWEPFRLITFAAKNKLVPPYSALHHPEKILLSKTKIFSFVITCDMKAFP
jgi:hypothetical protein